jgi:hypothetical protein
MTKRIITSLLMSLLCLVATVHLKAQAPQDCNSPNITMSCQNLVNISVGSTCVETITADKILAGTYSCYNTFTVSILNTTLGNKIGPAQIGQTLTVKVLHPISGNSCWGKIKVEDKLAPQLGCPLDATVSCSTASLDVSTTERIVCDNILNNGIKDTCFSVYGLPTVNENCTGYTLSYMDVVTDYDCATAGISAEIKRTWRAKDAYNNISTCTVTYILKRENISLISFPANVTVECSATYKKDAKGNPHPDVSGAPKLNGVLAFPNTPGYCEISSSYIDVKSASCGNTYKVIRKWTVIDWCTSQVSQQTQVVKIADTTPPTVAKGPAKTIISTDANNCIRKVYVPTKRAATDNCGSTVKFFYTLYETSGPWMVASGDTLRNLSTGTFVMETKASDECGNFVKDSSYLTIWDEVPPAAVCDFNTKVDITNNGFAVVSAKTFDDGSVDNCGIDTSLFEVKRMGAPDSDFKKSIQFSCADDKLQVILRIWDYSNNSNSCMVNVDVDDKMTPLIFAENANLYCAHETDARAWLDAHKPELKTSGDIPSPTNPGYSDNCSVSVSIKEEKNLIDNCGKGSYRRTWEATDASGNKTTTLQTVTTVNRSAYKITFPADKTLTCGTSNIDFSPKTNGEPVIENLGNTCAVVSINYIDEKYTTGNDGCYKIVRRWRVLNECENDGLYNANKGDLYVPEDNGVCQKAVPRTFVNIGNGVANDPNFASFLANHTCYTYDTDGFMEYQQLLKVVDNDAPIIKNIDLEIEDNTTGNCAAGGNINIKKVEVQDCSDSITVNFTSNIPGHLTGKAPSKLTAVPYGKYTITFSATDNCGNYATKTLDVELKEQKKPTPVCKDNINVELGQNGTVMVNAKLINGGSFDNCTPKNKLKIAMQVPAPGAGATYDKNLIDTMYTFSCSNLKAGTTSGVVTVALWVGDEAGNWDYCETVIVVQDNMKACVNNTPLQMKLSGAISNQNNAPLDAVTLKLDGVISAVTSTNALGQFSFDNAFTTKDYEITPSKTTEPMNGVSTLDLVLMTKHILGTVPFSNMYQIIAGDVNNNGAVTTADIVELRKMILGIQKDFSKNTSWRFVEEGKKFDPTTTNWLTSLPNKKAFLNLQLTDKANFTAVKIGDINSTASTSKANGNATDRGEKNTTYFEVNQTNMSKGETKTLYFSNEKNNDIEGYQFTLNYDKNSLELVDIQGNKENFGVLENGTITTSWNGTAANSQLFGLTFKAKKAVELSEVLTVNSNVINNELYSKNGEINQVALTFKGVSNKAFELYQNQPNPFTASTKISFNLPKAQNATITITDITGKTIKRVNQDFESGLNEITLDKIELGAAGILYYRLETAENFATRKMIIVE